MDSHDERELLNAGATIGTAAVQAATGNVPGAATTLLIGFGRVLIVILLLVAIFVTVILPNFFRILLTDVFGFDSAMEYVEEAVEWDTEKLEVISGRIFAPGSRGREKLSEYLQPKYDEYTALQVEQMLLSEEYRDYTYEVIPLEETFFDYLLSDYPGWIAGHVLAEADGDQLHGYSSGLKTDSAMVDEFMTLIKSAEDAHVTFEVEYIDPMLVRELVLYGPEPSVNPPQETVGLFFCRYLLFKPAPGLPPIPELPPELEDPEDPTDPELPEDPEEPVEPEDPEEPEEPEEPGPMIELDRVSAMDMTEEEIQEYLDAGYVLEEEYTPGHCKMFLFAGNVPGIDTNRDYIIATTERDFEFLEILMRLTDSDITIEEKFEELFNSFSWQHITVIAGQEISGNGGGVVTVAKREEVISSWPEDLSQERKDICNLAMDAVGVIQYVWGGRAYGPGWDNVGKGLDCSHFIDWVYWTCVGDNLGNSSTMGMGSHMYQISESELMPGDIAFTKVPGSPSSKNNPNHVLIYVGTNKNGEKVYVDARSTRSGTCMSTFPDAIYFYRPYCLD